ncbi:uncharacterized protein [Lepeophtheirus salmonis]|uniref:uncharacterized protein n=1 Tax=Lepeophtheirus salmonis TaxID=72036 RepID=UPI001AE643C9|nr:uncharacterized protein LOC121121953 [Lepeophtheirus salmonis]
MDDGAIMYGRSKSLSPIVNKKTKSQQTSVRMVGDNYDLPGKPLNVHLKHVDGDEKAKELLETIRKTVENVSITTELGKDPDCFEYFLNEKVVYSKIHLREYPNIVEMVEMTKWAALGKSQMHMFLCSFVEGGEPNMVRTDRKNTPVAKRVILACTIS